MQVPRPEFDESLARDLIGKYVLVGVTVVDPAGQLVSQQQVHGVIQSAGRTGIQLLLKGSRDGEMYKLPPDLGSFQLTKPGEYRLRSTGEVVNDPDYVSTWTVTKPERQVSQ